MYKKILALLVVAAIALPFSAAAKPLPKRMIVVFSDDATENQKLEILQSTGAQRLKRFEAAMHTEVSELDSTQVERLRANRKVKFVEEDGVVTALALAPQPTPWGIEKIGATQVWGTTTAAGIRIGIIDTGISMNNPDLIQNLAGGVNTIAPFRTFNDDNGHGSHVAGIVAATNNSFGVVGAAYNAKLYAIKALDARGSGYISDIIEGLDWAVAKGMQVVNLSLGSKSSSAALANAVTRALNAGVVVVAAAGNDGGSVNYPAAYPGVIAVGAIDKSGNVPSWSSRGIEVSVVAPGVSIYSTYKGGNYATLSGTSMATPHVVGTVALLISRPEKCQYLLDARPGCSPAEVKKRLEQTATQVPQDLQAGTDPVYGNGMVNAKAALLNQ